MDRDFRRLRQVTLTYASRIIYADFAMAGMLPTLTASIRTQPLPQRGGVTGFVRLQRLVTRSQVSPWGALWVSPDISTLPIHIPGYFDSVPAVVHDLTVGTS